MMFSVSVAREHMNWRMRDGDSEQCLAKANSELGIVLLVPGFNFTSSGGALLPNIHRGGRLSAPGPYKVQTLCILIIGAVALNLGKAGHC